MKRWLGVAAFLMGLFVGLAHASEPTAQTCTPADYAEFMERYQNHKSIFRRDAERGARKLAISEGRDLVGLGDPINLDRLGSIGISVGWSDFLNRMSQRRERTRIRVLDALEEAGDVVSGRKAYSEQEMPELALIYKEASTKSTTQVSLDSFAQVLLAESPGYCRVTSKGPELSGTDQVAARVAESLNKTGGAPTDEQATHAHDLSVSTPDEGAPECEPKKYVRFLEWKRSKDGGGRWQKYLEKALSKGIKDGIVDLAGFGALGPGTLAKIGIQSGWLGFQHWRAGRRISDRHQLMEAIEAAREMVDQHAETTTNAAFNKLVPKGVDADLFAAALVDGAESLCRIDSKGFPVMASKKETRKALDTAKADGPKLNRFSVVESGILYRGSHPGTDTEIEQLIRDHDIRTLVTLRDDKTFFKESVRAGKNNLAIINIPLDGTSDPSAETIHQIEDLLARIHLSKEVKEHPERYPPGSYDPARLIELPVYLHCRQGKDRTGLVTMLYRVLNQGYPPECAIREMYAFQFRRKSVKWLGFKATGLESYVKERFPEAHAKALSGENPACVYAEVDAAKMTLEATAPTVSRNPASPINESGTTKTLPGEGATKIPDAKTPDAQPGATTRAR